MKTLYVFGFLSVEKHSRYSRQYPLKTIRIDLNLIEDVLASSFNFANALNKSSPSRQYSALNSIWILPSRFHHHTIALSPSCRRVLTIVLSRFHHRIIAFSPSYQRIFTIVPSRHRTLAFWSV
jgi:hypothetical protein